MFDCMGNDIKKEEVSDPELNSLPPEACLRPQLPSSQLLTVIDRLGFNEGDISTSLLSHDSEELRTRSIDPPKIPQVSQQFTKSAGHQLNYSPFAFYKQ